MPVDRRYSKSTGPSVPSAPGGTRNRSSRLRIGIGCVPLCRSGCACHRLALGHTSQASSIVIPLLAQAPQLLPLRVASVGPRQPSVPPMSVVYLQYNSPNGCGYGAVLQSGGIPWALQRSPCPAQPYVCTDLRLFRPYATYNLHSHVNLKSPLFSLPPGA